MNKMMKFPFTHIACWIWWSVFASFYIRIVDGIGSKTSSIDQLTGIFDVFKNSNNASNEPSVDAWTYTPSGLNFIWLSADRSSFATSSL